MNDAQAREIRTMDEGSREDLADVIQNLFIAELLKPSKEIWIVSPWISDVEIIDNRTGRFLGLLPDAPQRWIRLSEIFTKIIERQGTVRLVTRPNNEKQEYYRNEQFVTQLVQNLTTDGNESRFKFNYSEKLHEKGLLTDKILLSGSMNFTFNGLRKLEEHISVTNDGSDLASASISFQRHWGDND